jgi:hypothetical protein
LTGAGLQWKAALPAATPSDLMTREGWAQERATKIWSAQSVYGAGFALIVLYLTGFATWTAGFALLRR